MLVAYISIYWSIGIQSPEWNAYSILLKYLRATFGTVTGILPL